MVENRRVREPKTGTAVERSTPLTVSTEPQKQGGRKNCNSGIVFVTSKLFNLSFKICHFSKLPLPFDENFDRVEGVFDGVPDEGFLWRDRE